ncbi:hypothetical protein DC083_07580 [Ignatzschineria ureiclastica]|uniref:Fe/B12 periplasmic-binding domain-containing protein n=1 Tax=Ignatzschineria ureiclastica TaxID=472582 RepID=A0A2U2AE64_9GAMM|nr:iron ABC transporter substrate-binding protein [Ignatzschineria ureiclastica]PWD80953.1 hypothetical protein DC083_07580 [Ignatzschineria ureiclastica]GGZ93669.1 iron ABC transporter substrate-binding protein [Ignatzschineria ureiclastica]
MLNRRHFLKTALASSLLLQFPALVFAKEQSFLMEAFGDLPKPQTIERILSAGPVADILLLSLTPNKLIGLASLNLSSKQKHFLPERIQNLPSTGRLAGRGSTAPLEKIMASKPDLIVDIGTVSPSYIGVAERVHQQTQIPYLLANGQFSDTAEQLRTLGRVLGVEAHGALLADYAEGVLQQTHNIVSKSNQGEIKVYSARGADGLETGLKGSIHTEVIEWIGATNVAEVAGEKMMTRVSLEQLMLWQPDVILIMDANFYQTIQTNPIWQRLKAVKEKRYYWVPNLPFGWLDMPPGMNRLLGASWLASLLVPERYSLEMAKKAIIEYFALFYQYYLSEDELKKITAGPQ